MAADTGGVGGVGGSGGTASTPELRDLERILKEARDITMESSKIQTKYNVARNVAAGAAVKG